MNYPPHIYAAEKVEADQLERARRKIQSLADGVGYLGTPEEINEVIVDLEKYRDGRLHRWNWAKTIRRDFAQEAIARLADCLARAEKRERNRQRRNRVLLILGSAFACSVALQLFKHFGFPI